MAAVTSLQSSIHEVDSVSAYVRRVLEVNTIKIEKHVAVLFKHHWGKDSHYPSEPFRTESADGQVVQLVAVLKRH